LTGFQAALRFQVGRVVFISSMEIPESGLDSTLVLAGFIIESGGESEETVCGDEFLLALTSA